MGCPCCCQTSRCCEVLAAGLVVAGIARLVSRPFLGDLGDTKLDALDIAVCILAIIFGLILNFGIRWELPSLLIPFLVGTVLMMLTTGASAILVVFLYLSDPRTGFFLSMLLLVLLIGCANAYIAVRTHYSDLQEQIAEKEEMYKKEDAE
ncbi:uncharacterized protein LOC108665077 [Hyalella azteca]|uniref:Uncharacterized protein LOC108665077 n=1 Tax=Hyalella azteca TaxID=294128 RepID=A0A8B7N0C2_HYAAZ|nr:uncharacterized protein LOC108665077 [Hyalella azteca]